MKTMYNKAISKMTVTEKLEIVNIWNKAYTEVIKDIENKHIYHKVDKEYDFLKNEGGSFEWLASKIKANDISYLELLGYIRNERNKFEDKLIDRKAWGN